jgi:hypothetical protein
MAVPISTEAEYRSNLETLRRQRQTYEAQLSDDPKPAELASSYRPN